jgi:hypothetical protein
MPVAYMREHYKGAPSRRRGSAAMSRGSVGRRLRLATDRFDVMAVRVPDEAAEVVAVVFRKEPWSMEHLSPNAQRSAVELANRIAARRRDGEVELSCLSSLRRTQPERSTTSNSEPHRCSVRVGSPGARKSADSEASRNLGACSTATPAARVNAASSLLV